jgi:hypothetical protein
MSKHKKHDQPISKPDPETLHTPDPQEEMEGPVSSLMNDIRENLEKNDTDEKGRLPGKGKKEDKEEE